MKTEVMSDILQRLEQLNEKELIQLPFKEVPKQEEEEAVFNHNLRLGQDVADKGKKF